MANLRSSKKDLKRSEKRRIRNQATRSALKTYVKKAKTAATGEEAVSAAAVTTAVKAFDKAVQRGIIHKNAAARRKSRMMKAINAAKAAA